MDIFFQWLKGKQLSHTDAMNLEMNLRVVTQSTSGWVPINISPNDWYRISDTFAPSDICKHVE